MKIIIPMLMKNCRLGCKKTSAVLIAIFCLLAPKWAVAEITLKNADFVALPGGGIELKFDFDAPPPTPEIYQINQPPRLVIDMWGVENQLASRRLDVRSGLLNEVQFAQTEGRLRIVTNLYKSVSFNTKVEGDSLYLFLESQSKVASSPASLSKMVNSNKRETQNQADSERTKIQGLDFERVEGGVGRITLTMSDDKAGVDIQEEGQNVVVNLSGAVLSRALEQRIDVQDFVTPVMFLDAMANGNSASILIKPSAEPYEYLAYQTNNQLILDFKPVKQSEKEARQEELFQFNGERIDLNFQNVELRSVLQIIAEVAELNLVVSDEVGGNITLRLKNVPWDQALDIVLKTKGLDKRQTGNVLLVADAFKIAEREKAELKANKQVEELAPLKTDYIQIEYRKASIMLNVIREAKLLTSRGYAVSDDQTNVLMIRDTAKVLQDVRSFVNRFDVEVEQVLVEARLVNATANVTKDLGVKWGFGYNDVDNGKGWIVNRDIGSIDFGTPPTEAGLQVDLGATVTNPGSIAIGFKPGSSSLLALELSALETDGRAEVVSQPKVMTTNGKRASIQSGSEIPFQTVEDGIVSIEFKDVVLSLDVTPRINPGDRIAMDLLITQDSIGQVLPNGEISIDNNELQTTVVVPDGQTIVLGGVFKNETSETINKVPLLGDLPVMGPLFRNKENKSEKTELLIFITPKLVRKSLSAQ